MVSKCYQKNKEALLKEASERYHSKILLTYKK